MSTVVRAAMKDQVSEHQAQSVHLKSGARISGQGQRPVKDCVRGASSPTAFATAQYGQLSGLTAVVATGGQAQVQNFIGTYGYLAIFILMVAESACIPIPSELTMPLGGALAAGAAPGVHLSLGLVIAVGVAGNVVGSYAAWAVGRYGGQSAWRRITRFAVGSDDGVARAQRWFDKYGTRSVFIGRLLPVIRTFISLPAGLTKMGPLRFGLYTTAGCIPWIAGLTVAGYAAGANWHRVTGLVQDAGYVVGAIAVVLIAALTIMLVRRRRRRRAAAPSAAASAPIDQRSDRDRPEPAAAEYRPGHRRGG